MKEYSKVDKKNQNFLQKPNMLRFLPLLEKKCGLTSVYKTLYNTFKFKEQFLLSNSLNQNRVENI